MRITIAFVITLALALALVAQEGPNMNQTQGPPQRAVQRIYTYSGTDLIRICYAWSIQPTASTGSISAASNANPVSFTSTGHGFNTNSKPQITISGATGNWTPINGTFTATITGANTFTIPVDSTAFGALAGTVVFSTVAPRTTQSIWAVQELKYSSGDLVASFWADGATVMNKTCEAPGRFQ